MKLKKAIISVLILLLVLQLLGGCQKSSDKSITCPFTTLTWKSSYDDMVTLEGTSEDSYESPYGGLTYTYPKQYLDMEGTVKYMYDSENSLVCIAWMYGASDTDALDQVYTQIKSDVTEVCGESENSAGNATNYGDVWYRADGNILLTAVTTNSQTALQYAYLSPTVSNKASEE